MEKIWLKSYPQGMPAEIDPTTYSSVAALLEDSFSRYAQRGAFACMGRTLTYAELDRLSRRLGGWLQGRGLKAGARVALMLPNILQYPVAMAAVLRAGFVVVNVNPLYTARELEHQLKDSGAEAIVILENFAATLEKVVAATAIKTIVVAAMGDLLGVRGGLVNFAVRHLKKMVPRWRLDGYVRFNAAIGQGTAHPLSVPVLSGTDIAFLQYTGGTTGVAKGATLLHRNIVANVLQSDIWLQPVCAKKTATGEQIITVAALPLYHIYALTVCGLLMMRTGGLAILIPNPRDLASLIKALKPYRFHLFPAVNTLYNALLNHPDFGALDVSALLMASGGGMAIQESVARRWHEKTGTSIIEGYGLSETSPSVSCNHADGVEYTGTIGLPLPSTEVSIRDDAGNEMPYGEPGEICIRGPQVMAGYWNRPEETANAMTADGFFKSGDIGVMDERGYIRIVDRKKDMILVSGFNVYPNEVEDVVASHPGVYEVAAVGVPDEHSGEAVKLFIVKRDQSLTADDIFIYCRERLTGYKRPKAIEFRAELPKSNVGKILRRELRGT